MRYTAYSATIHLKYIDFGVPLNSVKRKEAKNAFEKMLSKLFNERKRVNVKLVNK